MDSAKPATREIENLPCPCGSKLYHVIGPKTDLWLCASCTAEGKTYEEACEHAQTLCALPQPVSKQPVRPYNRIPKLRLI
jgi:hypothetical protein